MTTVDLKAEVDLAGTWTDASDYVYQRNPVTLTRGRTNEAATLSPASASFTVNNTDGRWTIRNPEGDWYGQLVQNTPIRFSVPVADDGLTNYLRLEEDRDSYATCPDSSSLRVTSGVLSVRVDGIFSDYQTSMLITKASATVPAWALVLNDGILNFWHYDGSVTGNATADLPLPWYGQRIAVRVDYDITNKTITFYTAATISDSYTQLGAAKITTLTALSGGTGAQIQIGAAPAGTGALFFGSGTDKPGCTGMILKASILKGSTTLASPDFTAQTAGDTSFTDSQSNTWTLDGTAEISDRSYRFYGELTSLPKTSDPSGNDVYADAEAYGLTSRLQQGQSPTQSTLYRLWTRLAVNPPVAYWPMEDGANATQFGPAIGSSPMHFTGSPTLASNTDFPSSQALPTLGGGDEANGAVDPYTPTDNAVGACVVVPSAGDTNNGIIIRFFTTGKIFRCDLQYGTGGSVELLGYDASGTQLFTSGSWAFNVNGVPLVMYISLTAGSTIGWNINTMGIGGTGDLGENGDTGVTGSIGQVTRVQLNAQGTFGGTAYGHCFVQAEYDSDLLATLDDPLNAWLGETAAARFGRLVAEEGYQSRVIGPPAKSEAMGYQTQQTIMTLLQECETCDQGLMFEPRQTRGIGYVTRYGMYNQASLAAADYSAGQVQPGFTAGSDTQLVLNDVTMTAADGSSARRTLDSGAMSIASIGRFDTSVTINCDTDDQLAPSAAWLLHTRSVDEDRFPSMDFQMAKTGASAPPDEVGQLDTGSVLEIDSVASWVPTGPVKQICAGFTETFMPQPLRDVAVNGIPETPYEVAVVGTARVDAGDSTLDGTMTTSSTSALTLGAAVWSSSAVPYDINIGGERMTVTAVAGGIGVQTLTVTRSVNGVATAHTTGDAVTLWNRPVVAR